MKVKQICEDVYLLIFMSVLITVPKRYLCFPVTVCMVWKWNFKRILSNIMNDYFIEYHLNQLIPLTPTLIVSRIPLDLFHYQTDWQTDTSTKYQILISIFQQMRCLYSLNFAFNAIRINSLHVCICIDLHCNSLNERDASFWKAIHANVRMQMDRSSMRSIQIKPFSLSDWQTDRQSDRQS